MTQNVDDQMLSVLGLEGHDSELFSFLDREYRDQLTKHPAATQPLWVAGDAKDGMLSSMSYWNTCGCFAWTQEPGSCRDSDGWFRYRGHVGRCDLLCAKSLVVVRYLFVQSYQCVLDDRHWVAPADPTLERLGHVRRWDGANATRWNELRAEYFDWALMALETVQRHGRRCDAAKR